jgi:hypothetical protein
VHTCTYSEPFDHVVVARHCSSSQHLQAQLLSTTEEGSTRFLIHHIVDIIPQACTFTSSPGPACPGYSELGQIAFRVPRPTAVRNPALTAAVALD